MKLEWTSKQVHYLDIFVLYSQCKEIIQTFGNQANQGQVFDKTISGSRNSHN